MTAGQWFRPPRRLPLLFLAVAVAPALVLAWLGWRLLEQDRALEAQHIYERLENAADLSGVQLRQTQAEIEEALAGAASLPSREVAAALSQRAEHLGDAAALIAFEPERVESYPNDRLLYYPYLPSAKEAPEGVFAAGEQLEFQKRDYGAAAAAYRRLAGSKDVAIRAGALLRLARTLRKAHRFEEALGTYRELEKLGSVRVEELPAELVARYSRCVLLVGIYFIARAVTREVQVAQLKSDFVSAVSHEFRSPLTTMRQLTEMLSKGRIPSEERRQQYYEVLAHETERLHRLVEGLLDFGRIEAGAMKYRLAPLDAAEMVLDVVAGFQEEVTEHGYRIELNGNGTGRMVLADREALGRALWNLLDNAVKYSPECRTVWVDVAQNRKELTIQVRDHGVGMDPDEQREVFKNFVRGATAQAAGVKGTGIGLATVDHIVRAHGGKVRVESEPGRGTAFSIVLPVME